MQIVDQVLNVKGVSLGLVDNPFGEVGGNAGGVADQLGQLCLHQFGCFRFGEGLSVDRGLICLGVEGA